jgi:hypothetical protein
LLLLMMLWFAPAGTSTAKPARMGVRTPSSTTSPLPSSTRKNQTPGPVTWDEVNQTTESSDDA